MPYNEDVFRYFLSIERQRSEQSGRSLLLLLIDVQQQPGFGGHLDPPTVETLFSTLRRCLRESDLIGWYRDERVAAAVLTQVANEATKEAPGLIVRRVREAIRESLPAVVQRQLTVRAYQLPPRLKN